MHFLFSVLLKMLHFLSSEVSRDAALPFSSEVSRVAALPSSEVTSDAARPFF